MVTQGTGRLLVHSGFDAFYDAQAASLLAGHWDVPSDAIMGEAFVYRRKSYGYFPFTPALPRMLLNRLFPSHAGEWTRLMMLLAIAGIMASLLAFMDLFEIASSPSLIAIAVLGSTLFFLCSLALVYHEAILTGSALALWAFYFFGRYLKNPRTIFLAAGGLLSFLAFFARFSVGVGPLLLAAFLLLAPRKPASHRALLAVSLSLTVMTFVAINHAKFDTWLNPAPFQYNVQYTAGRLRRIQGKISHFSNIPFNSLAYLGPASLRFRPSFPWLLLTNTGPAAGSAAKIDLIEGYSSIPAGMPALAILALLGAGFGERRWRPMLAAAFLAGCTVLTVSFITYRYVHDFYPFLGMAAVLGMGAAQSIANRPRRLAVKSLIAVAGAWSIAANGAFALTEQRESSWAGTQQKLAFLRLRGRIDSFFPAGKMEPLRYHIGDPVYQLRAGQVLMVDDPPGIYRYDGRQWQHVSGAWLHRFRLRVRFPAGQPNQHLALWYAGRPGASDVIYIVYASDTKLQFCFDHWGTGGACGPLAGIQPRRDALVEIDADRLNSRLKVTLDGQNVLEDPVLFFPWRDPDVLLGRSLAPAVHGMPFTGTIRTDPAN